MQFLEQLPIPVAPRGNRQTVLPNMLRPWQQVSPLLISREKSTPSYLRPTGCLAPERKLVLDWLGERREALGAEMPPDWRKLNALQASAGAWKDSIDGEQLKLDIRASRDIRTRPVPRL